MTVLRMRGGRMWMVFVVLGCFVLTTVIGSLAASNIEELTEADSEFMDDSIAVGWGLILVLLASQAGIVTSFMALHSGKQVTARSEPAPTPALREQISLDGTDQGDGGETGQSTTAGPKLDGLVGVVAGESLTIPPSLYVSDSVDRELAAELPGPRALLLLLSILGLAMLVLVGSVGPWGRFVLSTVSGLEGDGLLTLCLAAIASLMVVLRGLRLGPWTMAVASGAFVLTAAVGIYHWINVDDLSSENDKLGDVVTVEWGLVMVTAAAIVGSGLSTIAMWVPAGRR